jgi:hypothetical protein
MSNQESLSDVGQREVEAIFTERKDELHRKVESTRDAYLGYIFPITRRDFLSVARALELRDDVANVLYRRGTKSSTFRPNERGGALTNHITGAAILALRGQDLDTGLAGATDDNLAEFVSKNEAAVLEIAEARRTWFGRIFFPAEAFSNAIGVFGGSVSPEALYSVALEYGFAAAAGERKTVRGDFGIAVWMTLLARA